MELSGYTLFLLVLFVFQYWQNWNLHAYPLHSYDQTQEQHCSISVSPTGDGNFTTISQAILAAPSNSPTKFCIQVRSGTYQEVVVVPRDKPNIVLIGNGTRTTIITANRHYPDFGTQDTATFTVFGDGFTAKYITFQNGAGPHVHQAVALRIYGHFGVFYNCTGVFYNCTFMGFQDTLYVQYGTQFFRECDIYGTVDFIFGQALAVFQKCHLYARLPDREITFTAQGKALSTDASGFTFQGCSITTPPNSQFNKSTIRGFLGRPWRAYAQVAIMESYIDEIIEPRGWEEWPPTPVDNVTYIEFGNKGPGADTSRRTKWPGYKALQDSHEAVNFTAASLINGSSWIPSSGVPYCAHFISDCLKIP